MVGNGFASRADLNHLIYNDVDESGYGAVVWGSGDLDAGTVGDGNPTYEKTDDCTPLCNRLDRSSENDVGLLVCGDNIAYDLSQNLGSVPAIMLMSTRCGVHCAADSFLDLTGGFEGGGIVNQLVTGAEESIFWNMSFPCSAGVRF